MTRRIFPRVRLRVAIGTLLIASGFAGCATLNRTSSLELTPVVSPPTGVHHQGKFVWQDLLTDDVDAARQFYGQLFGWTFTQQGRYTVVLNDGQAIAGIVGVQPRPESDSPARWIASLSVADVNEAAQLVKEEGGTVYEGPVDMVNRGRGALVRDPQGAPLLLLHSSVGDPEDAEPTIGSWLWNELWSNVPAASFDFYQKLVGYDVDDGVDYWILKRGEDWRAGLRYVPDDDLEMRWVPVVRVADTADIAARVENLAGRLLVEPRPTASGGSVALLSDPSGALLIVQRWSPQPPESE
jgi:predicted enzyme related to lactoylglutathione lyase